MLVVPFNQTFHQLHLYQLVLLLLFPTKTNHQASRDQLFDLHLEHTLGMLERIIEAGVKAKNCLKHYLV